MNCREFTDLKVKEKQKILDVGEANAWTLWIIWGC